MTSPVEACVLFLERSVWVRKEQQTLQAAMCLNLNLIREMWPHSHHGPPAGGWPAPAGGDCEHPGTGSFGLHKSYINSDAGKIQPSQG